MVKVCVVGAGLSGLTVAHELIEKGFDVDVYEKHHTAGGTASSEREKHNVPGEHSWRGYGPFYYNVFDIMSSQIFLNKTSHRVIKRFIDKCFYQRINPENLN